MKKTLKPVGLIVLAAVITFGMTACDNGTGPNEDNGPVSVTGVSLSRTTLSVAANGTASLTANIAPTNATNKSIAWSSDDENIVTVEDGVVCAVAVGETTITVTTDDGGKQAACVVTVVDFSLTDTDFFITNSSEWNAAKTAIRGGGNNQNYTVYVSGNVAVTGSSDNTFGTASSITVTLKGSGTLSLNSTGNLLHAVSVNQTLIIDSENLTLRGRSGNSNSVVYIGVLAKLELRNGTISGNTNTASTNSSGGGVYMNGGTFTMSGGQISGNTATYSGGVYMNGGTFTMSGGEITGNTSLFGGGGVFIDAYGTFNMTGGKVSDNKTTAYDRGGGGILVYTDGTFNMRGGKISGNTADGGAGVYAAGGRFRISAGTIYGKNEGDLSNTASMGTGASLFMGNSGIAEYGTFSGTTWNKVGNLDTTNDTIMVINGELVKPSAVTAQFWRVGTALTLTTPTVTLAFGYTVTAQGWQISDNGSSGWSDFTPPATADMSYNGKHLRYYATISGGGTVYSNTVTIRVFSETEREVTIDMYDSLGDGWNANGALRINVNEVPIATSVRVQTTAITNTPTGQRNTNTYTFLIETGDIVDVYWTVGTGLSYQYENSFIMYYTDMPPSPAFTASNNNNWSGTNALVYRLRTTSGTTGSDYLTGVADGTLLGSFTVP